MNKAIFRLLVVLMSASLIGIIFIQVYWFNTSLENNLEQFKFQVNRVISNVADKLQEEEAQTFFEKYDQIKDSLGVENIKYEQFVFGYYEKNNQTNQTIIYSNSILAEDFNVASSIFNLDDSTKVKKFSAVRNTKIYNSKPNEQEKSLKENPDIQIKKFGDMGILDKARFEIYFKDIAETYPIQKRVSKNRIQRLLKEELAQYGINTPFEFSIYSNGLATKVKSESFAYDKFATYNVPIFINADGEKKYQLLVTFPDKKSFLFSNLIGITLLSLVFTLIIIIAYYSAINQLIRQRQISEIKTDFINNMTHEFKTPIATINLALDAIKNPKIIEDRERMQRYLQMIRDENKRMHAQVENVLRISKLEKKELEMDKDSQDVNTILNDAIEHVSLILEDKNGTIQTHFQAKRTIALLNDIHFTNVFVNILENAIKYSIDAPKIDVYTENIKDYLIIKIKDEGIGMSKTAQKKIFEKFFREHTGDIHNVKGHGLGLAYVKKIVDEHDAQIFVESEKGKGSTFILKIPLIN